MPNRRLKSVFVTMPPDERARLDAYAQTLGRPLSWVCRDALRVYLDTMEPQARALGRNTKTALARPVLDGSPPPPAVRLGRPRKVGNG